MINQFIILLSLLVVSSCSKNPRLVEERISYEDAPNFLKDAGRNLNDPEYTVKRFPFGKVVFEVKEAQGEKEVSLVVDSQGALLEKEEEILFNDLGINVRTNIMTYIEKNYLDSEVIELERRTTLDNVLIDVEIRHDSSPTGFWELSFNPEGRFKRREIENEIFRGKLK